MQPSAQTWIWLGALAATMGLLRAVRRFWWGFSLILLPGTLAHELCHLVTGWLLNGHPVNVSLLPKRQGRSVILGSVGFRNLRWYNAFFVGMAPLLLAPLAWWALERLLQKTFALGWLNVLWLYLIACLVQAALPSGQDLRIAARSPVGWVLLAASLAWGLRRAGIF
jgi:hypothetical protein